MAASRGPATRLDVECLRRRGLGALVRMEPGPVAGALHPDVVELGMEDCLEPVQDFAAPSLEQVGRMVSFIQNVLDQGSTVGVSCRAGLGRTGVVLACYLVSTGLDDETSIRRVRRLRPGSIEVISQEEVIREYHRQLQKGKGPDEGPGEAL